MPACSLWPPWQVIANLMAENATDRLSPSRLCASASGTGLAALRPRGHRAAVPLLGWLDPWPAAPLPTCKAGSTTPLSLTLPPASRGSSWFSWATWMVQGDFCLKVS